PLPSFFYRPRHHRYLHSFPTRRSSDLNPGAGWPEPIAPGAPLLPRPKRPQNTPPGLPLVNEIARHDVGFASVQECVASGQLFGEDRKSTRLNSSHLVISYAVFCLKKKK